MNDAQRYRLKAAECLSAAKTCAPPYRGPTLDMATSWLSLARQAEAELIARFSYSTTAPARTGPALSTMSLSPP
jgi:hypothetical protein